MAEALRRRLGALRRLLAQLVKVIGPPLHHAHSFREVCRAVVGATVGILHCVRKLVLNDVRPKAEDLVEDRAGRGAEAVAGHRAYLVAHAAQCRVHRVV